MVTTRMIEFHAPTFTLCHLCRHWPSVTNASSMKDIKNKHVLNLLKERQLRNVYGQKGGGSAESSAQKSIICDIRDAWKASAKNTFQMSPCPLPHLAYSVIASASENTRLRGWLRWPCSESERTKCKNRDGLTAAKIHAPQQDVTFLQGEWRHRKCERVCFRSRRAWRSALQQFSSSNQTPCLHPAAAP